MPTSLAVPAAGLTFLSRPQCGLIAARPFIPMGIAESGKSFINVANANQPGGPGAAIAPPPNGAGSTTKPMSPPTSLTIRLTFNRHDDSGVRQFEYGFGGAIASPTPTR